MGEYYTVEACTTSPAFEVKLKTKKIDLKKAETILSPLGHVLANTDVVMTMKIRIHAVSIYASGRMLFKNATKKESEKLANELIPELEKGGALVED